MYTDTLAIIYLFIYRADVAEDSNTHWLILLKPSGSPADKVPVRLPMIYQFAMFVKMALSFNSGWDWPADCTCWEQAAYSKGQSMADSDKVQTRVWPTTCPMESIDLGLSWLPWSLFLTYPNYCTRIIYLSLPCAWGHIGLFHWFREQFPEHQGTNMEYLTFLFF